MQTVLLQLSRLQRHYDVAVKTYDEISLLDLSHTLRIWADLKPHLPTIAPKFGSAISFKGCTPPKEACRLAFGHKHVLAALSGMVTTYAHKSDVLWMPQYPSRRMASTTKIRRCEDGSLELGSVYIIYGLDPSITANGAFKSKLVGENVSRLNYAQWMGADAVRVGYENEGGKVVAVTISREMLIRRVANTMDGSHPSAAAGDDYQENQFDLPVKYLMEYKVGGLPLPYFLLLKIAQDILKVAPQLLETRHDNYLLSNMTDTSFQIEISPALRGTIGVTDLLTPKGFLCSAVGFDEPARGLLFRVRGPSYELACFFDNNSLVLTRNGQEARADLGSLPRGEHVKLIATVMWGPSELLVGVAYHKYSKEITYATAPTFPPNALLEWARREALAPSVTYADGLAVHEEVVSQMAHLADRIIDMNAINPFWDVTYDGQTIIERKPKRETDIHPLIRLLLSPLEILRGLQVVPEYPTGTGKLDFLISGRTTSNQMVHVCVEFKLAHSPDIAHGIKVQLPEYMNRVGTDYGIYCVIDFGATHPYDRSKFKIVGFDGPSPLNLMLPIAASDTGRPFLRTLILDVARKVTPSKA